MRVLRLLVLLSTGLIAAGAKNPELEVVDSVDLQRYQGRWYEIARLPNWFQNKCDGFVAATYTLRQDNRLDVINQCREKGGKARKAEGVARVADEKGPNTKLEVRFAPAFLSFLPFVWGKYWIIDLDPNYRFAVIGEPSRKYLWILCREPRMDAEIYESIVDRATQKGFDTERLLRSKQVE